MIRYACGRSRLFGQAPILRAERRHACVRSASMEVGLMRGLRSRLASDEGMTIIEIMVASVILLVVLTALIPLVFHTTQMTAQTEAQTLVTNYVNSMVEEIRAMPYEQVGLVGSSELPGSLEPSRTVPLEGGYTLRLALQVDWVDDPQIDGVQDYKEVRIDAEASAPDKPGAKYSTVTYVWGDDSMEGPLPEVSFSSSSPAREAVVDGTSVAVGGRANTSAEGRTIVRMTLKVDSDPLPDAASPPSFAQFSPMSNPAEVSWLWDTTAKIAKTDEAGIPLRDANGDIVYSYFSPDGWRMLKVEAWDNVGMYNYVTRKVLVDNYAPYPVDASSLVLAPYRSRELRATWNPAPDGTDPADAYDVKLYMEPKTPSDPASWEVTPGEVKGGKTSASFAAQPFSRYRLEVRPKSPRGLHPEEWASSETTTTAPELTGTYTRTVTEQGKGKNKTFTASYHVNAAITPPTFLPVGQVTYEVFRSTDLATLRSGLPCRTMHDTISFTDTIDDGVPYPSGFRSPDWYYVVRATFTPATDDTHEVSVWSNVVKVPGVGSGANAGTLEVLW